MLLQSQSKISSNLTILSPSIHILNVQGTSTVYIQYIELTLKHNIFFFFFFFLLLNSVQTHLPLSQIHDGIELLSSIHLYPCFPHPGDRRTFPNIAIVMTDGESMIKPEETLPEARLAREQGIIVFAVGIGSDTSLNQAELEVGRNSLLFYLP